MTIRHLKIFIAVADTGKMSLAAKRLYIAQPTVSQVIAEIEETYGVCLFERLSKKLYITEAGERLLRYARHIVSLFDEMERSLRNSANQVQLRVGATITVGSCVLTRLIRQFEKEHPLIQIQVVVDNTHIIEEMLLESALDLGLVEGSIHSPDLVVQPVIQDELVLVCGEGHPFAARESIDAEELEGQPFILREEGSGTRALLEDFLKAHDITIHPKWICYSSDSILQAVAGEQGLTVISRMLVDQAAQGGRLRLQAVPVRNASFSRYFSLVTHKDKFQSSPLRMLMEMIANPGKDYLGS